MVYNDSICRQYSWTLRKTVIFLRWYSPLDPKVVHLDPQGSTVDPTKVGDVTINVVSQFESGSTKIYLLSIVKN
jgi:hypothetical protein